MYFSYWETHPWICFPNSCLVLQQLENCTQQFGKRFPNCWGGNFPTVVVLSRSLENRFRDAFSPSNWNPRRPPTNKVADGLNEIQIKLHETRGRVLRFLGMRSAFLIANQNASLIKESKNTPIWWKERSDWLSALFTFAMQWGDPKMKIII